MNGDSHYHHTASSNAVAGPSRSPQPPTLLPSSPGNLGGVPSANAAAAFSSSSSLHHPATLSPVALFLPPPAPPPPKQYLDSTQDLLARFHLLSAYDRYVRPAILPGNEANATGMGVAGSPTSGDKGKGREVDMDLGESGTGAGHGGEGDDDDGAGGKGEKKKKNTYKHLIKGLPGKHNMKKDDYLTTMMMIPPKQRMHITPFDAHTQEDAFTVSPEGLKGWNPKALVLESAQAREDRRKRKELKRLALLQQQQLLQQQELSPDQQISPSSIPLQAPIPTPASSRPQGVRTPMRNPSTPRSTVVGGGTPRPGSTVPRPTPSMAQSNAPSQPTPTVQKSTVPRPGSTVPRPGSAVPANAGIVQRPGSTKPHSTGIGTPGYAELPRGKKREREDGVVNGVNGIGMVNGTNNLALPKAVVGAKAGVAGVRPRPVKKQRMDVPGQSNGPVQQQPTPQGV